jgi:hypothetical protein
MEIGMYDSFSMDTRVYVTGAVWILGVYDSFNMGTMVYVAGAEWI